MSSGNVDERPIVILLDESSAMAAVMRDKLADGSESTKTNAERVATSVNQLVRQLAEGPRCSVALVGYRSSADGTVDVGCRWPAALAGRSFVASDELAAAAENEQRTRRVPLPDGSFDELTIDFPVWYRPELGAKGPQLAAFRFVADLLKESSAGVRPVVIHLFCGSSADGSPQMVISDLLRHDADGAGPIVIQCHLAAAASHSTIPFPSNQAYLSSAAARDLFSRASRLPAATAVLLRRSKFSVLTNARAMVHNAKITDLHHCLQVAKECVIGGAALPPQTPPSITAAPNGGQSPVEPPVLAGGESPTEPTPVVEPTPVSEGASAASPISSRHVGEPVGFACLILDRSVADPQSGDLKNACSRLQEAGNEILKSLTVKDAGSRAIDVAIVSYGAREDGSPDVRDGFDGPLAGKSIVRNTELASGPVRVEESQVEMSNGAGGIITITKKLPIFFDVEPTASLDPKGGFEAAARIIRDWCTQHPDGWRPVVVHLTRGERSAEALDPAVAEFAGIATSAGPVVLQHLVLTESPRKSVCHPDSAEGMDSDGAQACWNASTTLPGWEALRDAKRPHLTADSRGCVVNGQFDILAEEFVAALPGIDDTGA
jgi:hypothetical protein